VFGGLDGCVAEQTLDLFQIPAAFAAELGACAAKIVRAKRSTPISPAAAWTTCQMVHGLRLFPTMPAFGDRA